MHYIGLKECIYFGDLNSFVDRLFLFLSSDFVLWNGVDSSN